jgi:hypothetical protein
MSKKGPIYFTDPFGANVRIAEEKTDTVHQIKSG